MRRWDSGTFEDMSHAGRALMLLFRTLLYLPTQVLVPLFQFVAAVVWTHWFAPEAYGVLMLVMATQDLVFMLCLSWWSHYMMRYLEGFGDGEARGRFEYTDRRVLLVSVLVQPCLTVALLALFGVDLTWPLVFASAAFMLTRSVAAHWAERARAQNRIAAYAHLGLWGAVGGFFAAHALVVLVGAEPWLALAGFAAAQTIGLGIGWRLLARAPATPGGTRAMLTEAFRYGGPLLAAGGLGWLSANGVRGLVEHGAGAAALGLMAVGWGLGQRVIGFVAMLLTAAAYPLALARLNAGDRTGALEQIALNGALLFGLLAPAVTGVIAITPALVALTVAPDYQTITLLVLPIAVLYGAIRNMRVHYSDQVFLIAEATPSLLHLNAFETVLTLAGAALGLALGGAVGACIGCLGGALAAAIAGFVMGARRHGLRIRWRLVANFTLAALLMLVAILALQAPPTLGGLLACIAVGAGAYAVAALAMLAIVAPDLSHQIRDLLSRRLGRAA